MVKICLNWSGISRENLDINRFTNKFLETKTTADISVDANANVNDTSMLSWNYEFPKALMKLNSLYHLWTSALKKHGIKRANKMIELEIAGGLRIHDLHRVVNAILLGCLIGSYN